MLSQIEGVIKITKKKLEDIYNQNVKTITPSSFDGNENSIFEITEDIEIYEKWVDVIEFLSDDLSKEATLFHVYKDQKTWPGNLNLLLTNLNYNIDNRAIPVEIGKIRANCG